jgi:hypothetical protein
LATFAFHVGVLSFCRRQQEESMWWDRRGELTLALAIIVVASLKCPT